MPTATTEQVSISLLLDGQEYNCQVIDATLEHVGESTGDTVEVACGDGPVIEPGEHVDGAFNGTVFTDTTDAGISWALMQAHATGATIAYEITWFSNEANTVAYKYAGDAQVGSFQMEWTKPGNSRHPIDLVLKSGTISRPA